MACDNRGVFSFGDKVMANTDCPISAAPTGLRRREGGDVVSTEQSARMRDASRVPYRADEIERERW
jgi:hypothetical protein